MANSKKVTTYAGKGQVAQQTGDYPNQDEPTSISQDTVDVTSIVRNFKVALNYAKTHYWLVWEDCFRLYNNLVTKRGYEGISQTFVPETHGIVESLVANITGSRPKFTFLPTNDEQESDTTVLNALIDYYWDADHMSMKVIPFIRDVIIYGTAVMHVGWNADENRPMMKHVPVRDFFADPMATSIDNARFAGYRYLTTVKNLKEIKKVDPTTGDLVPMYDNLDKVAELGDFSDRLTDKEIKDIFMGSTLDQYARKDQIEVIFYTTKDKIYEVANRQIIIREDDNPTTVFNKKGQKSKDGLMPFVVQRNYVDNSLLYGKGDVEVIKEEQALLNDITNQQLDNISYVMNNMWWIDPEFGDMAPNIESIPGAVYPVPKDAMGPFEKPIVTQVAAEQQVRIKEEMRKATAADELAQGTQQTKGDVTATEVNAQLGQAGQRFAMKLMGLENEGYRQLADIIFRYVQLFVSESVAVRTIGRDGVGFKDFDPEKYKGDYEPKVVLEINAKSQKLEDAKRYTELYQVASGNPLIGPEGQLGLLKLTLQKVFDLDDDEMQIILGGADQQQTIGPDGQPMPQAVGPDGQPMAAGAPGQAPTPPDQGPAPNDLSNHPVVKLMESLAMKFSELPTTARRALLDQLGLPSDGAFPDEIQTNLAAHKIQNDQHSAELAVVDRLHKTATLDHTKEQAAANMEITKQKLNQPAQPNKKVKQGAAK